MFPADAQSSSVGISGAAKRHRSNGLPKVVWLHDKGIRSIVAVCILVGAHRKVVDLSYSLAFERCVALNPPMQVDPSMRAYTGSVFELKADAEMASRNASVSPGGKVMDHFPGARGDLKKWRVISLSARQVNEFRHGFGDPSKRVVVDVARDVISKLGVTHELVDTPLVAIDVEGDSSDDEAPTVGIAQLPAIVPSENPTRPQTFELAVDELMKPRLGGAVGHTFTTQAILESLKLSADLRPGAGLSNVVAGSAVLLFGHNANQLALDIRSGKYPLPGGDLIRSSRLRLDIMSVLFQQQRFLSGHYVTYDLLDSSPQLGFNILGVIEDWFFIPDAHTLQIHHHLALEALGCYGTSICPLSSLGLGKVGLIKKSTNGGNILLMHYCDREHLEKRRKGKRGVTADQGTERGHGDISLSVFIGFLDGYAAGSTESFLFPYALQIYGFLHVLYNGFEEAVKSTAGYMQFQEVLRVTVNFTNDKNIRQKYIVECLGSEHASANLFKSNAKVHIDWKWEFLSEAIPTVLPRFRVIQAEFDDQKC